MTHKQPTVPDPLNEETPTHEVEVVDSNTTDTGQPVIAQPTAIPKPQSTQWQALYRILRQKQLAVCEHTVTITQPADAKSIE